uniref:Oncosphere protein TSOL16A n=1 Tax=Taenia solium TaxID=6204 RepID=Q867R3_TAESO|nr:oncosphere protein TSOL16A [Taenia solium]AAN74964.1 oncosphere protein TSOL16A [Taenia solium]|eukprot:TsM_000130200 transcript=TsM_000130200 gene=TsM_000130200
MLLQVCLILLATSALSDGFGEFGESTLSGDTSLRRYTYWSHKGHNALLLSWIGSKLAKKGVKYVSVFASPASKPHHIVHKSAGVAKGRILLQGLLANTEYVLTTQALGNFGPIFVYTLHAKTWQTDANHPQQS